ncbi:hypothetical protein QBC41DRAFT_231677 [Cercophora samala]|uniref:Uncharacterized protein n=1 Tax=Cercophora samala TaxID=330535 RepID=A0AA39Z947_9PEZI|nr:hypothetical protein QBC41DRAFT_231677 [Cercophora samala]
MENNIPPPPRWYTTTQYLRFKIPQLSEVAEPLITRMLTGSIDYHRDAHELRVWLGEMVQVVSLHLGLQASLEAERAWEQSPHFYPRYPWPTTDEPLQIRAREQLEQEVKHLDSQHRQIMAWVIRQQAIEEDRQRDPLEGFVPMEFPPDGVIQDLIQQLEHEEGQRRDGPSLADPQPAHPPQDGQLPRMAEPQLPVMEVPQPPPDQHQRPELRRLAPKPVVQQQPHQNQQQVYQPQILQSRAHHEDAQIPYQQLHQQPHPQFHQAPHEQPHQRPVPQILGQEPTQPQQSQPQQRQQRRVSPLTQFLIDCGALPPQSPEMKQESPESKKEEPRH